MNSEFGEEHEDECEEEFDPTDPWDRHVVDVGKKISDNLEFDDEWRDKPVTDQDFFDLYLTIDGGAEYRDGFGSGNPGEADWVLEKPEKIAEFDEGLVKGKYCVVLQYLPLFQTEGPGTFGHVWGTRLWDQKKDEEIQGSRFLADKLSYAVTESLKHMPEWGHKEWKPTKEDKEFLEKRKLLSDLNRISGWFDFNWQKSEKSKYKKEIYDSLITKCPPIQEIIKIGGAAELLKNLIRLNETGELSDKDLRDWEPIFRSLNFAVSDMLSYYEDPRGWKRIGTELENNDEGDGWLPSPNWRE